MGKCFPASLLGHQLLTHGVCLCCAVVLIEACEIMKGLRDSPLALSAMQQVRSFDPLLSFLYSNLLTGTLKQSLKQRKGIFELCPSPLAPACACRALMPYCSAGWPWCGS